MRRGNGDGTVRQRANGRWEGSVQFHGTRHWVTGATKAEVRRHLTDVQGRFHARELVPPSRLTLAAHLDAWLEAGRAEWRPTTYESYRGIVEREWRPALGVVPLQQVTAPMIAACYTRWRAERDVAGGTLLNAAHRCLKRALTVAARVDGPQKTRVSWRIYEQSSRTVNASTPSRGPLTKKPLDGVTQLSPACSCRCVRRRRIWSSWVISVPAGACSRYSRSAASASACRPSWARRTPRSLTSSSAHGVIAS